MNAQPVVSALVAVYNEERHLAQCLETLLAQSYQPIEIIVADDGSTDASAAVARRYERVRLVRGPHAGKARALNAAAREATGEILLFLDGDLYFDRDYVAQLVRPILDGRARGSCHAVERVANPENRWSRCWQRRAGLPPDERLRLSVQDIARGSPIFRALRADAFHAAGGFDDTGHTDDHTLHPKLGEKAVFAPDAVCFHYNVETLGEVFGQGVWGGKSIHHAHGARALLHYAPPRSLLRALRTVAREQSVMLAVYDLVHEAGIFRGLLARSLRADAGYGR
jgi:glycosyltransferase involved in cell wall biosynthesis